MGRKCDVVDCDKDAIVSLVWTKPMFYCASCAGRWLGIAMFMSYPTPADTLRMMTVDEMLEENGVRDEQA